MAKHRINIALTDEEEAFLKWFAKRDGISVQDELNRIFSTEFDECIRLYEGEMIKEKENT